MIYHISYHNSHPSTFSNLRANSTTETLSWNKQPLFLTLIYSKQYLYFQTLNPNVMCGTAISADTRKECTFVHDTTGLYNSMSHCLQGILVSCCYIQGGRGCWKVEDKSLTNRNTLKGKVWACRFCLTFYATRHTHLHTHTHHTHTHTHTYTHTHTHTQSVS